MCVCVVLIMWCVRVVFLYTWMCVGIYLSFSVCLYSTCVFAYVCPRVCACVYVASVYTCIYVNAFLMCERQFF